MVNAFRVTDDANFPPTRDPLVELIKTHRQVRFSDGWYCCIGCDVGAVWTYQEYVEHLALKIRQERLALPVETAVRSCDCIGYCECGGQG